MKLHAKYKEILEEKNIGKLEKAYFTTFNIDLGFVEKYIIPPLLGDGIPDNNFSLEDLNIGLMDKKAPEIKFFYDANMLATLDKKTIVETYPILIKGGVFHPKVIYLQGSKAAYLLVGSGNLTFSGWGRNIEAFEIIEIKNNENIKNQILNFFDDIFYKARIEKLKPKRAVRLDNEIDFIYSCERSENSLLLESLKIDKSLQIYSPYFSDDLDSLFEKEEFKQLDSIKIVPDLIENQKVRLKQLPADKRVKFYRFDKKVLSTEDEDSTNHSKIWISETKYAIGSHNCTEAALYGKNYEASIVKSLTRKGGFSLDDSRIIKPDVTKKNEDMEDEVDVQDRFNSLYKLVADYKNNEFKLTEISSTIKSSNIKILLPSSCDITIKCKELSDSREVLLPLSNAQKAIIFRALVKNKIFEIQDEDSNRLFRGLIIELNVTDKTRFSNSVETLDDIFLSFLDEKNPTEAKHIENRRIDIDRDEEAVYKRKYKKTNVNYFTMFTGFKNLHNKLQEIKSRPDQVKKFCYTSASSLVVVKNIIEQKMNNESLFMHLMILEFNKLVEAVNRLKIDDIKLEPIQPLSIKLEPEDKRFIKEMMK